MKPQKLFYILLILWVVVDMLLAVFTPLHADEAYYALYGQYLDWGYFDHPPMVALLTAFSDLCYGGYLSIRYATVLLHGATVWLIWKSLPDKALTRRDVLLFFAIAASLVMFSVYGFMTTPDVPLLFFTALFFYLYKRYLATPNWSIALGLGITFAAMLYSKYMAVLVAGFVLLSNLKLLKDKKVWIAMILALLLFVPHILWQVRNDFPSLQYHLLDRNTGFRWIYPLEYPLNQLLVFNPVCLCLAAYFCWKKRKTDDLFERAGVFTIAGFLLFFWVMTVKGHAEPHWTVAASVPMIILLWQELRDMRWEKWVRYGIVPIFCLLMVLRVVAPPLLTFKFVDVLNNRDDYKAVQARCGNTPLVFLNSFQKPSLYRFYIGGDAVTIGSYYYRRTQFDLWQFDKELQGKRVYILDRNVNRNECDTSNYICNHGKALFRVRETNAFQGANRIEVTLNSYRVTKDSLYLDITLYNPYALDYDFAHPEFSTRLYVSYIANDGYVNLSCLVQPDLVIPAGECVRISTAAGGLPGTPFIFCLDNGICQSMNSKPIKLQAHD